jgi:hypothetical protein
MYLSPIQQSGFYSNKEWLCVLSAQGEEAPGHLFYELTTPSGGKLHCNQSVSAVYLQFLL